MTATIDTTDMADDREPSEGPSQIMFLVKRRAYELAIVIPHAPQVTRAQDHPRLHICLTTPRQSGAFRLDLATLQGFQQDLRSLLEYVQSEGTKLVASKPSRALSQSA